jgi:ribosomal protein S14
MKSIAVGELIALIDDEDYEVVAIHAWRPSTPRNVTYAVTTLPRTQGRTNVYMHRLILRQMGQDGRADHKDGNGLNNRRSNLRLSTASQNGANTPARPGASAFKGVSRCSKTSRWRAYIRADGRQIHLGQFDSESEAAAAYDRAAMQMWGEYAKTNL